MSPRNGTPDMSVGRNNNAIMTHPIGCCVTSTAHRTLKGMNWKRVLPQVVVVVSLVVTLAGIAFLVVVAAFANRMDEVYIDPSGEVLGGTRDDVAAAMFDAAADRFASSGYLDFDATGVSMEVAADTVISQMDLPSLAADADCNDVLIRRDANTTRRAYRGLSTDGGTEAWVFRGTFEAIPTSFHDDGPRGSMYWYVGVFGVDCTGDPMTATIPRTWSGTLDSGFTPAT
jgi:hypothetical protein